MDRRIITFGSEAGNKILSYFDKTIDSEGFIVERDDPEQRVITPDGEEINIDEFAGIRKGSEIFIKSDLPSLLNLSDLR